MTYWLAKMNNYDDKVVLSDEHQDFKWLDIDQAVSLSGFKDMAQVFKNFNSKLSEL